MVNKVSFEKKNYILKEVFVVFECNKIIICIVKFIYSKIVCFKCKIYKDVW